MLDEESQRRGRDRLRERETGEKESVEKEAACSWEVGPGQADFLLLLSVLFHQRGQRREMGEEGGRRGEGMHP